MTGEPATLWSLSMAALHVAVALGFGHLFCTAPDRVQKFILLLMIVSALSLLAYYAAALFGHEPPWEIKAIGYGVEHAGVLLYLFRIYYRENLCPKSSPGFPRLPA